MPCPPSDIRCPRSRRREGSQGPAAPARRDGRVRHRGTSAGPARPPATPRVSGGACPTERVQQRRLARSVPPHERQHFAGHHHQVDAVERHHGSVRYGQVTDGCCRDMIHARRQRCLARRRRQWCQPLAERSRHAASVSHRKRKRVPPDEATQLDEGGRDRGRPHHDLGGPTTSGTPSRVPGSCGRQRARPAPAGVLPSPPSGPGRAPGGPTHSGPPRPPPDRAPMWARRGQADAAPPSAPPRSPLVAAGHPTGRAATGRAGPAGRADRLRPPPGAAWHPTAPRGSPWCRPTRPQRSR